MSRMHSVELRADASSVDEHGHINNVRFIEWMQDIAREHAEVSGLAKLCSKMGTAWYIRSHQITYHRPGFEGDEIELETEVDSIDNLRSVRRYRFTRVSDGVVLASASTEWVMVDIATGRPRRITDEIRALFFE